MFLIGGFGFHIFAVTLVFHNLILMLIPIYKIHVFHHHMYTLNSIFMNIFSLVLAWPPRMWKSKNIIDVISSLVKMKITATLCILSAGIKPDTLQVPFNFGERLKERENTCTRARGHVTREERRKLEYLSRGFRVPRVRVYFARWFSSCRKYTATCSLRAIDRKW